MRRVRSAVVVACAKLRRRRELVNRELDEPYAKAWLASGGRFDSCGDVAQRRRFRIPPFTLAGGSMRTIAPLFALLFTLTSAGAAQSSSTSPAPSSAPVARFDWFEYSGRDSVYQVHPAGKGEYLNPILAGFYPDPALPRVGNDYYLVASTFAYFPGIPIFRSQDLVNWTQIGNVIHRPEQLKFDSLGMSRGVFAPTINFHAGRSTSSTPASIAGATTSSRRRTPPARGRIRCGSPRSGGIDPSIFFDDDGKAYVINNDEPTGGATYQGHRAIWIREFDLATKKVKGPATQIINAGVDITQKPIWIEGPHIYKIDGKYYLSCAEGGTAVDHRAGGVPQRQRARPLRARARAGQPDPHAAPPRPDAPVPRHLGRSRRLPADAERRVVGNLPRHAAVRRRLLQHRARDLPDAAASGRTAGRSFVGGREPVRYALPRPKLPAQPAPAIPTHGNFTVREDFNGTALAPYWMMLRTPRERWWQLKGGALTMRARPDDVASKGQPSFVGRRQQHQRATFTTAMRFAPRAPATAPVSSPSRARTSSTR